MTLFKNKYRIETTRLKGWDYATAGWYFVTVCTRSREHFFGEVVSAGMLLNDVGDVAAQYWRDIPSHFPNAELDEFVVMPNHVHGIVVIREAEARDEAETRPEVETRPEAETRHVASLQEGNKFGPLKRGSVSKIIQAYKAAVTRWCRQNNHAEFDWQPRFYDHIVRNEKALDDIRQYIVNNPAKWELDRENQEGLWM